MDVIHALPLFPLSQPLYPGVAIRLRIFEQRYLRLVRESVSSQKPFAVFPIVRGSEVGGPPTFYPWGTLASIIDWDQQDNGLLEITICGSHRVKVENSQVESDGLIIGDAQIHMAEPEEAPDVEYNDLEQLLDDLVASLRLDVLFAQEPLTVASLGWRLATLLPLDRESKMALLAERNPHERLGIIRSGIADMIAEGEGRE